MEDNNGEHPLGHAGQLISLGVFMVVWVSDSFLLHRSTFLADYLPLWVRLCIVLAALVTAVYLFKSGHAVAGHGQRAANLVTTGAFSYIRHPLYAASLSVYLGMTAATTSLFSLAVFGLIVIFHDYIAGYEERSLEARFGEEYREYQRHTGKWLPGVGKRAQVRRD
jgi:protein-S-isoprenylcysteine O-methyltransferase Ste14